MRSQHHCIKYLFTLIYKISLVIPQSCEAALPLLVNDDDIKIGINAHHHITGTSQSHRHARNSFLPHRYSCSAPNVSGLTAPSSSLLCCLPVTFNSLLVEVIFIPQKHSSITSIKPYYPSTVHSGKLWFSRHRHVQYWTSRALFRCSLCNFFHIHECVLRG